ncbi:major facilitator superfamily domain-containing protein [Aspergillus stella-maris]|uniref:major facilitator superfamily domain-containing protein n=1 Tax=Aspergillus stella-maris TaxID=1810926 RepID=UPI003CCCC696
MDKFKHSPSLAPKTPHTEQSKKALDVAAVFLESTEYTAYTQKEEKALRWRLDKRLIPLLFFNVTLGAVDKSTISTGALYGLRADCEMTTGNRYAWAGSAFYFGYLLWCFPSSGLLQKFPIAKTMMVFQIMWGVLLIGTGFANNFETFVVLRFLLGAIEAPIIPGLIPGNFLVMGMWYTRQEQPLRTGLFYTGLSSLITGPLGYVVGFISGQWYLPWRALFWIVGSITIGYALVIGFFLPDSPVAAKFVNDKEKYVAINRLRADQVGIENKVWKREQFIDAFADVKTWIMVLLNIFINIPNGALGNFTPLIISGLGYNARIASLMFILVGVTSTASCYMCNGGVFLVNKHKPDLQVRGAFMAFGLLVGMISTVFLYTLPLTAIHSRLTALLMAYFYLGPYVVSVGMVAANTAGYTKKITVNALIFMAYCVSNIIGPFFFKTEQAPLYSLGMAAMLFSYGASFVLVAVYMAYCWNENRQRDALAAANPVPSEETEFRDLTDKQNPNFRYVW